MHKGLVNIRPVLAGQAQVAAAAEGRSRLPADELFHRYYLQRMGTEPPQELIKLFVELLDDESADETGGEAE